MEELIKVLYRWSKPILVVCLIAAIGSTVVALLLPNYYTSQVVFLPTNPHMMDRNNLFTFDGTEQGSYLFGGVPDMNRLISLSRSSAVENYIIDKYNLYTHYDIDTNDVLKDHWVKEELHSNFKLIKTAENMLEASVTDKDPILAAEIANGIVNRLDSLNKNIIREKKSSLLSMYQKQTQEKGQRVEALRDSLSRIIKNNPKDTVNTQILTILIKKALDEYVTVKIISEQQATSVHSDYSTIYVIEQASPAVQKSRPVRWLIVFTATLTAFFASVLFVVFWERFRDFRWE